METKFNSKKQGFTLIEVVVVLSILSILAVALVPNIKGHIDNAKKLEISNKCRELVIAVETYNSEVRSGEEIVHEFNGDFLAFNGDIHDYQGKDETKLEDILRNVAIQHLLGDDTNKIEEKVKEKQPSPSLRRRFIRIPNNSTYNEIQRVAEGAKFTIDSEGMLYEVSKWDSGNRE